MSILLWCLFVGDSTLYYIVVDTSFSQTTEVASEQWHKGRTQIVHPIVVAVVY
jgi:hypothetical protein